MELLHVVEKGHGWKTPVYQGLDKWLKPLEREHLRDQRIQHIGGFSA